MVIRGNKAMTCGNCSITKCDKHYYQMRHAVITKYNRHYVRPFENNPNPHALTGSVKYIFGGHIFRVLR